MKKNLPERKQGTCTCMYGLWGPSINRSEFFLCRAPGLGQSSCCKDILAKNQLDLDGAHGSMDAPWTTPWIWANIAWGSMLIGLMDSLA